ncbi:MAG: peptidoglycan editing factor PgeF [Gemmatimonadaceae bacterium]
MPNGSTASATDLSTPAQTIAVFADMGVHAFITVRAAGTYSTAGSEPVSVVMERWRALLADVGRWGPRFASSPQVHGDRIVVHEAAWEGCLRTQAADGHATRFRGTALAVSVADCVPVFLAHPSGATALLHSGWRGTAARIVERGVAALAAMGCAPREVRAHLGPAICGPCYEVSQSVHEALTGRSVLQPTHVDLRSLIAAQARVAGVRDLTVSPDCTRCHRDRFFSHRGGDAGRQLAVMVAPES